MGVPAFYRWLSEKYPKIVTDILEERIHLSPNSSTIRLPFDCTKPNPSNLECDNFYIDMNGIIHPCSHPENGPQPKTEEDMYENVCRYVDRLFRAVRPRRLLYLAIDGVAPRAKMNQQRSRRFRSAQDAREQKELEEEIKENLIKAGHTFETKKKDAWDSNVITPGTNFMLNLSEYVRFYIRKRISTDPAWKQIQVIFSDASIPGEGEHKIMSHIRLQRTQTNYNPNLVHILHGLDADLIMLALATHEAHFYIMREEVLFGRRSAENAQRKREESGFTDAQQQLDEAAGPEAMALPENQNKILQRISIPVLREYLGFEFRDVLNRLPAAGFKEVSFERLIDDVVFLCFFVGNDFLPHLPSLDIRDGALDFLFNVYKRLLPTLGDFITNHGGQVNLSHVDVILAEVGAIEDYVFQMKHQNELNQKKRKEEEKARRKQLAGRGNGMAPKANYVSTEAPPKVRGRAARILSNKSSDLTTTTTTTTTSMSSSSSRNGNENGVGGITALGQGRKSRITSKEVGKKSLQDNAAAAAELRAKLMNGNGNKTEKSTSEESKESKDDVIPDNDNGNSVEESSLSPKRKADLISTEDNEDNKAATEGKADQNGDKDKEGKTEKGDEQESKKKDDVGDNDDDAKDKDFDDTDEIEEDKQAPKQDSTELLKNKMKEATQKKLNDYAENVDDKVKLHETGWKNRYYTDKCKADDVLQYGGKEHLFRSYVVGLCWVMKYYYEGCPSWKWFYPFHYAPFASDLKNIERFQKDCVFELGQPFTPVEQLMGVLPEDSSHAIPKASRWLMSDPESPILDFYPKKILCDPNGKAMPWLWVVLLPFIDEERLLAALHPTMKNWKDTELLCNARGLDDGYVFCHINHKLSSSVVPALDSADKTKKLAIEDSDFFGYFRCPLSNEIYPLDKVSAIHPPVSSTKITSENIDELLTSPIETNAAICASFTEPTKVIHKSVLLSGATPPAPILRQEDFRINRPRLNRGGGTIANMGGTRQGQSHQVGYGSMNIGSYERDLALKSGRGNQLHQAGTRQWGAMEPTPKRQRTQNGYAHNHQQQYRPNLNQGRYPNYPPPNQAHQQHHQGQRWQAPPPPPPHHFPPPPPHPSQLPQRRPPNQIPQRHSNQSSHQPRRGHNFQNYNRQNATGHAYSRHGQYRQQQQQQQQRSGLSSDVMSNLRSQLASTLNKNRQGNRGNQKR